jgi:DNA-binding transcriptional MerR regulator
MYKIGDFSQIAQVSVRMLRHYDKLGLLNPDQVDKWTGYRYYTLDQLSRLHRILALRDLGLSLEQVGDVLDDLDTDERLHDMLLAKQRAITEQLAEEQARLDRVAARLRQIQRVHEPIPYDVALKVLPDQYIAAIREVVPHVSQMGVVRDRVFRHLYGALAEEEITPGTELAVYHAQAYTEDDIDMSLAVEIAEGVTFPLTKDSINTYNLPQAPLAASIVYKGDMWNIPDVVVSLYRWMGMNGYTSCGPYRELHLFGRELDLFANDPPGDALIEFLVPVEKL